jgi:hydrogenase nickel incorporation protein HypB
MWEWRFEEFALMFIENVGNLVCPTSYDLGEDAKVVVLSVAEGEDKPLKYPGIFRKAELMILNKIDLLPYVPFKPELACEYARRINPEIQIIRTSAITGAGFDQWLSWLDLRAEKKQAGTESSREVQHALNES